MFSSNNCTNLLGATEEGQTLRSHTIRLIHRGILSLSTVIGCKPVSQNQVTTNLVIPIFKTAPDTLGRLLLDRFGG